MVVESICKHPYVSLMVFYLLWQQTTRKFIWIFSKRMFWYVIDGLLQGMPGTTWFSEWRDTVDEIVTPVMEEFNRAREPQQHWLLSKFKEFTTTRVNEVTMWLVLVSLGFTIIYSISGIAMRRFRRYKYQRNGYSCEAIISGSAFRPGTSPGYQVSIEVEGMFSFNHNGYGLRVLNYLVMPAHVVGERQEIMMRYKDKTLQCSTSGLKYSKFCNDLVYLYIPADSWSLLGVKSCAVRNKNMAIVSTYVSCSGFKGVSNGYLVKSEINWMMEYRGSTENGYSGAAYHINNALMGMHLGCSGKVNMGITSNVIFREATKLEEIRVKYAGESSEYHFLSSDPAHPAQFKGWTNSEMDRVIQEYDRYDNAEDSWLDDDYKIDYGRDLGYDSEAKITLNKPNKLRIKEHMVLFKGLTDAEIKAVVGDLTYYANNREDVSIKENVPANPAPATIRLTQQSDGKENDMQIRVIMKPMRLGDIVRDLDKRVAALENKMTQHRDVTDEITAIKNALYVESDCYECPDCKRQFGSDMAAKNHYKDAHKAVVVEQAKTPVVSKPESAFPGDNKPTVKTDKSFLGKRSISRKTRKRTSKMSSTSSDMLTQSQFLAGLQSLMNGLTQSQVRPLGQPQQAMAGPSLVNLQN